jgi:hypothetical protein
MESFLYLYMADGKPFYAVFRCPSQESNPEPTDPKSGALSIELLRHAQDYTRFVDSANGVIESLILFGKVIYL